MSNTILKAFEQAKIIPVYSSGNFEETKQIIEACYQAGLRIFEFTNRNENALEIFSALVEYFKKYQDLHIGIGTIFTKNDAEKFIENGAHFIVSPVVSLSLLEFCKTKGILYIPGCGSVTEVYDCVENGCELVKVFPANVLGTEFVKAVKSVIPKVKIMPTGGIEPKEIEIKKWLTAGVTCVGMGSKLFDPTLLQNKDYTSLTNNIKNLRSSI
jgi:2-dehydro-3-deoxyphosphogluconate aldolase / (4S)-4-hydroxy-2-oxoglutarate aldolase